MDGWMDAHCNQYPIVHLSENIVTYVLQRQVGDDIISMLLQSFLKDSVPSVGKNMRRVTTMACSQPPSRTAWNNPDQGKFYDWYVGILSHTSCQWIKVMR
jgi:hypothetical protein